MKNLNKKGFTLIELLAVIVVLGIILVITVPMILNTLGDTRQSALQSSANATAKYVEEEIGLAVLGKSSMFNTGATNNLWFKSDGDICGAGSTGTSESTCKSETAELSLRALPNYTLLGLNENDYNLTSSKISWDANGKVTVKLVAAADGKFDGTTTATSGVK